MTSEINVVGQPSSHSLLTISAKFTVLSKAPGSASATCSAPRSAFRRASIAELSKTISFPTRGPTLSNQFISQTARWITKPRRQCLQVRYCVHKGLCNEFAFTYPCDFSLFKRDLVD